MSLVQGYSSSEDEDHVEKEQVQKLEEAKEEEEKDDAVRSAFTSLPAPSSKIKRKPLPLLDELEAFDDDDDDEDSDNKSNVELSEKIAVGQSETENSDEFVASNFETANVKRQRFIDVDEDDESDVRNIVSTKISSKFENAKAEASIQTMAEARNRSTFQGNATTSDMGFRQPLNREMAEELRSASKSNSQFVELSSRELRQDAVKYQQGGITSNLHQSRGVSGRQNQISFLAKVAAKQREEKS